MLVRVYSKPSCAQCTATKRKLTELGIDYVEEDATAPENVAAFKELGFATAPIVAVGMSMDDMWSGYRPDRIKEIAERIKQEEK